MASAMDADRTTPFVDVKRWRARDRHTGIGKDVGVPYTYELVDVRPLTMAEALEELRAFRIAAESAP